MLKHTSVPAKGNCGPPKRDIGPHQMGMKTVFNYDSLTQSFTYFTAWFSQFGIIILAPGVIQLTLLDATTLDRIIMDLARDPRYSSVLHMRTGMDTRSSGGSSSTAAELLQWSPSDQGPPAQASSSQAGPTAENGNRPPNPPVLPMFPGSTEVDWMSWQLGLVSRAHYRMLDDLLSPIGRHLVPVSVGIIFICLVFNYTSIIL